jgi:hypothetical protein
MNTGKDDCFHITETTPEGNVRCIHCDKDNFTDTEAAKVVQDIMDKQIADAKYHVETHVIEGMRNDPLNCFHVTEPNEEGRSRCVHCGKDDFTDEEATKVVRDIMDWQISNAKFHAENDTIGVRCSCGEDGNNELKLDITGDIDIL